MVIISIFAKIIFSMGGILMHYALGIGNSMRKISLGLFGLSSVDHLGSLSHSSYFSAKTRGELFWPPLFARCKSRYNIKKGCWVGAGLTTSARWASPPIFRQKQEESCILSKLWCYRLFDAYFIIEQFVTYCHRDCLLGYKNYQSEKLLWCGRGCISLHQKRGTVLNRIQFLKLKTLKRIQIN